MDNGVLNLADLDGSNGFVIRGVDEFDFSGSSVSSAGDVNGDGIDDLIIGAFGGESYVVFGTESGFNGVFELANLDGSNGFIIQSINNNDGFGRSVSSAGDVNGDGIDDLIIGAPYAGGDSDNFIFGEGESYIVFGTESGFDSVFELANLDGSNGFVIRGIDDGDSFGRSVSGAGDVNGDGIDDIIISAPYSGDIGEEESYVVFGTESGFDGVFEVADLDGSNGFVIQGIDSLDLSGNSVSSAGDVNGDGLSDIIIGANDVSNSNSYSFEGKSYVIFGTESGFDGVFEVANLDGGNGFVIPGIDDFDSSGASVSSAGDVNGDGIDDLIIGAPGANSNNNYSSEGESYVVFGTENGFDGVVELANLDGSNGFVIRGVDNFGNSGRSVSSAGDINGDGIDDLIIGAPYAGTTYDGDFGSYNNREGESYVVFGTSEGFDGVVELADLDGSNGFVIRGIDNNDNSGRSVSSAGDINGDGIDDLIIDAPNADSSGNYSSEGESYVIFGVRSVELTGTNQGDILDGGNGNDTISGLNGNDIIDGGAGQDSIAGGNGNDNIIAGSGNDEINGDRGADIILGEEGNDTIFGGAGKDNIIAGSGNDEINGDGGADTILGEEGNDTIFGGAGNDILTGGIGDDNLSGGNGKDTITGGVGNDFLNGGSGNDRLSGVDSSTYGTGEIDTLSGGFGRDTFVLGDADNVFYDDGDALTTGESDFALITDFNSRQDSIELSGSAEFYTLDFFSSGFGTTNAAIIYDSPSARGELIAIVEDVSSDLDINDSAFEFLG